MTTKRKWSSPGQIQRRRRCCATPCSMFKAVNSCSGRLLLRNNSRVDLGLFGLVNRGPRPVKLFKQQAQILIIGEVLVYPIDKDLQPVFYAKDQEKVYYHPSYPGDPAVQVHLGLWNLYHC